MTGGMKAYAGGFDRAQPAGYYETILGGETHPFAIATRDDYDCRLRDTGLLDPGEPLTDHPELCAAVQAHWHAAGSNGCLFAAYLSEHRRDYGWETWVLQ